VNDDGSVVIAKAPSTPRDPSDGLVDGLTLLAASLGTDLRGLLATTERIVHGTTTATNALLERKGATVGLLTTEGHRDVLEMREGLKDDRYNLRMPPPVPLVPRVRRIGVRERVRADGKIATPLSRTSLDAGLRALAREGVDAVAVCYLHSYRNARHEELTRRAIAARLPRAYVSLSSEVLPQIKEYERVCTTVVNAYVGPALATYLEHLAARLRTLGYRGELLIMQSHGGVAPLRESARLAAGAVLSGPAGGIAGGRHCVRLMRPADGDGNRHGVWARGDAITFDMGGTSTDIALLQRGEPQLTGEKSVGGSKVALPSIDIHTLGAGGGSIARVDGARILHVGPESAGADPGPACYGKGGTRATVTDANVVLGFLDPASFLGGRIALDTAAAEAAVAEVAQALGTSVIAAAEGIHQVVDTNMAEGIKIVSVRRRRRPARHRGRAAPGDQPRPRAAHRRGAVRVGHAGDGPALRARALARERIASADRRRGATPLREAGARGAETARDGTERPSRGRAWPCQSRPRAPLRGHALRRADLRGPGRPRRHGPRGTGPGGAHGRALPHEARGAVQLQRPRSGGGARQRAGRGHRRASGAALGACHA
jgi:N-methylhydantoinase A